MHLSCYKYYISDYYIYLFCAKSAIRHTQNKADTLFTV